MPADVHYINCAYNGPLLRAAYDTGQEALKRRRHPWEYTVNDFFDPVERVKHLFSELIQADDPGRIAILPSASYGFSTIARNLDLAPGDNLVVVEEQFPSNVYPWMRLCKESGAALKVIPRPAAGGGKAWNQSILQAMDARTRAIAIGHVHWTDGTLFDLPAILERATRFHVLTILDGTQSVGALPFNLPETPFDAVICAAYKWLLGPYAIGLAYYGPWFDGKVPIEENWINRLNSDDFKGLVQYEDQYRPKANRYSVGENSNFLLIPVLETSLKQVLKWGPRNVQTYCSDLAQPAIGELRQAGYRISPAEERGAHLFGIGIPDAVDLSRLQSALKDRKVFVSLRGSAIRVSPHVYNTPDDMAALVDVLTAMR